MEEMDKYLICITCRATAGLISYTPSQVSNYI